MLKRGMLLVLALLMCMLVQAGTAEITIEEVRAQMGENTVVYPQLSGMENEAVQQKINDDIVTASGVTNHMVSLFTLTEQQTLKVEYDAWLNDDVFSAVISAKGRLPKARDGHAYTALSYDLQTGERVTLDQLFTDAEAAVALMEQIADETLSEELNGYLEYSELTPLPVESFTLNETGITFWYPAEQFSLISGYSGACQFWYEELEGMWQKEMDAPRSNTERKTAIEHSVSQGVLPGVPVSLGQNMQQISEQYRLLRTPDEFPGGRYFLMEHPAFRSIPLISDALTDSYEDSILEGIQLRRGGLHGLLIGKTTQSEWRTLLGEPESSLSMTQSMAFDYGLSEGSFDVYQFGGNELRLYADLDGVLFAIQLCN